MSRVRASDVRASEVVPAAMITALTVARHRRRRRRSGDDALSLIVTSRTDRAVIYGLLIVMGVFFAFPMYAAVAKSLQINGFQNYVGLFTDPIGSVPIWQTYLNSLAIGVVHTVIVLFVSTTAGYAFSKLHFRGRDASFSIVLLFLAVPGVAIIVPVYRITQELGLFNNYIGVGLPEAALTIPFGVLLLRNHGRNIPESLFEAASIDGAGPWRMFLHIFLPLSRPAVVNLTILCFVWSMQDFLWPAFIFTDPRLASAAQAVQTFSNALGKGVGDIAKYNASLVLLALPAVAFVLFGLRFIVNGLANGAMKE